MEEEDLKPRFDVLIVMLLSILFYTIISKSIVIGLFERKKMIIKLRALLIF